MAHEMTGTQIVPERLVALLESGTEKVLLIDSRPFVDYNTSHILEAININCSKLMKRRLQQDKVSITVLGQHEHLCSRCDNDLWITRCSLLSDV